MLGLVFDTSTKWLYVALVQDEKVLAVSQFCSEREHSANFLYIVETMLRSNDFTVDDLTDLYCGYGPGSYTGERISVTVAKMLASFKNIKLHQVSSLYLAGSGYQNKNVAVIFDARRGNCFCALYGENHIEDKLRNQEEFLKQVENLEDLKVVYEDDFKVDPLKAIKQSEEVNEVDGFVPNYLRISEAEYNLLKSKND